MATAAPAQNASGLAPVTVPIPHYQPAEPAVFAKKRTAARKAALKLTVPSDKKYTNWLRQKVAERFADRAIGTVAPKLTIDQPDYDTGIKTIAIPLSKAIADWPDHVSPHLMGEALPADYSFVSALSGAIFTDGAVVVVPDNTRVDIVAEFAAEAGKLHGYRTIIIVGENAEATFTEQTAAHAVADETIVTHGVEVYAKAGSKFSYYGLQEWPKDTSYFPTYRALTERDATVDWLIGSFGSKFSQIEVETGLNGPGAETAVRGVYYGSADQHFDQLLTANHMVGDTSSDTYARGVVEETGKAVYRGMIKIQPGAHGSSADQNGHAMLLGNSAHIDSIPGLEIDADDVVAGHGATVGQIDEEKLFYLMARGISRPAAIELIIRGFFEDLFKRISNPVVRERFWAAVEAKRK